MIRRLPLVLIFLATPAAADIPTIDGTVLDERRDRNDKTTKIDKVDRDRYTNNESVTCAVYRPGREDDPVAAANANPSIAGLVRRVAREEGVDENQFLALVYQESRFNPCAKSGAGAIGLAQLMPGTASDLGVNPYNIEQNLRGGARYFKQQLRRFDGNVSLALAAYNSGSGNVESYGGIPPFRETQDYVRNITQKWLPAFGGSDKSGIPLNYGGTSTAYEGMRSSTINAFALTSATGAGSGDVASWFEQFGATATGTVQDSWDQNSGARNANIDMLNRMIALGASFADLVNSKNAVTLSDISGASRSGRYQDNGGDGSQDVTGFCDDRAGLTWDSKAKACVQKLDQNARLLLVPQ
ncbi:lytic transglycosylase domain-containing protein [Mesorhizobium sp. M0895]|uniref:lytic transglycosylase domain-containing protein n=1 Tax=Mesorhizobium sp. M0895 TaxID=2957019 RepID=UPI003336354E